MGNFPRVYSFHHSLIDQFQSWSIDESDEYWESEQPISPAKELAHSQLSKRSHQPGMKINISEVKFESNQEFCELFKHNIKISDRNLKVEEWLKNNHIPQENPIIQKYHRKAMIKLFLVILSTLKWEKFKKKDILHKI